MTTHAVPDGWYQDPNDATRERYWDGRDWGQVRPRPPQHASVDRSDDRVGPASIAVALLIPLFGLIISIVAFSRGRNQTGIAVLLTSIVSMVVWSAIVLHA